MPAGQISRRRIAECHLILMCAWLLAAPFAAAQAAPLSEGRGEMLYQNHCVACHTTQVHWRDQRLANDWISLRAQVRRWERNTGLTWSDEDVEAVSQYLNQLYYQLPDPPKDKAISWFIRQHRASEGQGNGWLPASFSDGD
jgi:mono/diheme cytochrome c family protein